VVHPHRGGVVDDEHPGSGRRIRGHHLAPVGRW
jgi:hypothetical protein